MKVLRSLLLLLSLAPLIAGAATVGDVTLTWDLPTANTDGSPLTDLAGCNIYRSSTPNIATFADGGRPTDSTGPTVKSFTVRGLAPGTYYFALTCYSSANRESGLSNVVSTTIATVTVPRPPTNTKASTSIRVQ